MTDTQLLIMGAIGFAGLVYGIIMWLMEGSD